MITLKVIQTVFSPNHGPFPEREKFFFRKRRVVLSFCKSNNSDNSDEETPQPPPPQGDQRKQELLARIAMLQTQKVRLTDYLDERSDYLTQFAEEANAEIDLIGENALKELDEAGARIMGNIESQMQAFEESMELNKVEIEESEKKVADFEGQYEKDRNEGLFFKNLGEKKPVDMAKAKEEAEKISELTKKSAGSVTRRNIYIVLMGLVVIGMADASISSSPDWRKVAFLGVVLVGLVTQLVYEQSMLSETDDTELEKSRESKRE
ncbi:8-amino-7-oxononanoate synthase [Perilla frutescens var. hirtella]|uniref:8-amino-7-oxononanoate synthase n=1 Tax=Perilla frutescens var. hirtella TaxID=608512 RepID=A0AAD4J9B1_PERFH|nr:8-amino-7-oxononanoate synthase [Perilla frutescens var. hirtella]KAH6806296.1 8-amino-7-oxononanoate synthase [Perilla frutescens var. frutescens]KAH6829565.1 8-amino-7-oxononanoate synthase [Perilla frutescens var. hirtella]